MEPGFFKVNGAHGEDSHGEDRLGRDLEMGIDARPNWSALLDSNLALSVADMYSFMSVAADTTIARPPRNPLS